MKSPNTRLLQPLVNCWRLSHAERLAFLIDGAAYFRAFREAVCQARHSVLILSWDIDTRLRLIRDGETDDFPDSLGDFLYALARERWRRATGKILRAPPKRDDRPWPPSVTPDLEDQTVAIARTEVSLDGRETVREVESLYLEAIASAQRFLYIENQYLSSWRIAEALTQRLRESEGPEIVMVLPLKTGDWLEQHTMDVLRSRLLRRLREADHQRRLRVYYPQHQQLGKEYISLHSKLLVMDGSLLLIGSANLSNRSMGFDSECNLAIEALDDRSRQAVTGLRNRLLAEHLGATPETVAARIADAGSLILGIEDLCGGQRSLESLEGMVPDLADELLPDHEMVDPEKPVTAEQLADQLMPEEERRSAGRQIAPVLAILATLLGLAAAWRWTPLGDLLNATVLVDVIQDLSRHAGAPLFMIAAYLIGGFIAVPVTLLIIVTVLAFGPWPGFGIALVGAELSALATFGVGHGLGRSWVRRFTGQRVNQLSRRLAHRGILAMTALRIVPVAPFTVVNLVAGASHIRLRDFAIGSLLGLIPGTLAIAVFTDQVAATIRQPDLPAFAVLAGVAGGIIVGLWALSRWIGRRGKTSP